LAGSGLVGHAGPGPTVVDEATVVPVPCPLVVTEADDVLVAGALVDDGMEVDVELATLALVEPPPPQAASVKASDARKGRGALVGLIPADMACPSRRQERPRRPQLPG
jgi:hypothetical protein